MTKAEIFEEIRTLLLQPQTAFTGTPQTYDDAALVLQVRSALRWVKAKGVPTDASMDANGILAPEPSDDVGFLVALRTASALLRGDMINRLQSGELGLYFRAGTDIIDTKTVAQGFQSTARQYDEELQTQLAVVLSDPTKSANGGVFGDDTLSV